MSEQYYMSNIKHIFSMSCECRECSDSFLHEIDPICEDCKIKDKSKKITWYRPSVIWKFGNKLPNKASHIKLSLRASKEQWLDDDGLMELDDGIYKVIDWETVEAPDNWEQCE